MNWSPHSCAFLHLWLISHLKAISSSKTVQKVGKFSLGYILQLQTQYCFVATSWAVSVHIFASSPKFDVGSFSCFFFNVGTECAFLYCISHYSKILTKSYNAFWSVTNTKVMKIQRIESYLSVQRCKTCMCVKASVMNIGLLKAKKRQMTVTPAQWAQSLRNELYCHTA